MIKDWRWLLVCLLTAVTVIACDPASRIQNGMPERDVLKIMGRPSRTVEDAAKFREELVGDPKCIAGAQRILVYNIDARRRVRVVIDANARVTCVVKTDDMMF